MSYDIKEIQNQFNKVLSYSQTGLDDPRTDDLFNKWFEAKKHFIELMHDELIYEVPYDVSFDLDENSKKEKFDNFLDLLENKYQLYDLVDFNLINKDGFYSNQVVETKTYHTVDNEEVTIPKGMKLVKAYKFFIKDEKILNEVQSVVSMIIQENKVTGRFCISVHPLDFLSSSENTHNWRSCHALDGEYRSGNISYMVDNTTFICYLKSKTESILPNFPDSIKWNSKKWRTLMFIDNNYKLIFAGRQYPFSTNTGLDFALKEINNLFIKARTTPWIKTNKLNIPEYMVDNTNPNNDFTLSRKLINIGGNLIGLTNIVKDGDCSLNYNDLTSSTCYEPIYAIAANSFAYAGRNSQEQKIEYKTFAFNGEIPKITIGGPCNCLRCNQSRMHLTESFMCDYCEMKYGEAESDIFALCPNCDERFIYDEGYWVEDEEIMICPECAEYYYYCEDCECLTRNTMTNENGEEVPMCTYCASLHTSKGED